ncbi:hypothetical protein JCM8547_003335 [Rhodosporidiobolus lusitaniae]
MPGATLEDLPESVSVGVCPFTLYEMESSNKCLQQMVNLERYTHSHFPRRQHQTLSAFALALWDVCPITVAAARHSDLPRDEKNAATLTEQALTAVHGLAKLLFATKDTLQALVITFQGLYSSNNPSGDPYAREWLHHHFERLKEFNGGKEYPSFPNLVGLRLVWCNTGIKGLTYLLNISPKIKEVELVGSDLKAFPGPYDVEKLKKLEYILKLSGVQHHEVLKIISHFFPHLVHLMLLYYGVSPLLSLFPLAGLQAIAKNAPRSQHLNITGQFFACEALDLFKALRPLRHLRFFAFDHPWTKPRSMPFPYPDGDTIKTDRNGDFRVLSIGVAGRSSNQEIEQDPPRTVLARADVEAVTSTYHRHFASIAERHPSLREIQWEATDELTWTWTFVREHDQDDGKLLKIKHKVEIAPQFSDVVPGYAGVIMTG